MGLQVGTNSSQCIGDAVAWQTKKNDVSSWNYVDWGVGELPDGAFECLTLRGMDIKGMVPTGWLSCQHTDLIAFVGKISGDDMSEVAPSTDTDIHA